MEFLPEYVFNFDKCCLCQNIFQLELMLTFVHLLFICFGAYRWGGMNVKNDPRFELIIGDAYQYILDCKETFDCIIMDISDPIECGPGIMLYTKELYEHLVNVLSPNGVFATQAGAADAVPPPHANAGSRDTTCFCPIRNTLSEVFPCVLPYTQNIPSFGWYVSYCVLCVCVCACVDYFLPLSFFILFYFQVIGDL